MLDGILSRASSIISLELELIDRIKLEIDEEFASEIIKILLQFTKEIDKIVSKNVGMIIEAQGPEIRGMIEGCKSGNLTKMDKWCLGLA